MWTSSLGRSLSWRRRRSASYFPLSSHLVQSDWISTPSDPGRHKLRVRESSWRADWAGDEGPKIPHKSFQKAMAAHKKFEYFFKFDPQLPNPQVTLVPIKIKPTGVGVQLQADNVSNDGYTMVVLPPEAGPVVEEIHFLELVIHE